MAALLDIHQLCCQFDQDIVLDGASFSMQAGELCSLLGPSGCGKTTLLRAIAGFKQVASGHVVLNGEDITRKRAADRGIGFVFQDYALFPHLTVEDNVAYGIHHQGNSKQRVNELLELVDLDKYRKHYPHEISGGQQQRVALARALAPKPALLLLDEPFSNLDTELRKSLNLRIREILKTSGQTAILVTHDQTEAFAFGDHVGILNHGRLEQWGTPYTLYHEPVSRFVAEFIGNGQLIEARVINAQQLETDFGLVACEQSLPVEVHEQASVSLLTRPDDWQICETGEKVTIRAKQFIGTQTIYHVEAKTGQKIRIATPSHQDYVIGSSIAICPQFEHIITFL